MKTSDTQSDSICSCQQTERTQAIKKRILDCIEASLQKKTPLELAREIANSTGIAIADIRAVLQSMVEANELAYFFHLGQTIVDKSFNKPVQVSKKILLVPPHIMLPYASDRVLIRLQQGASFGDGQHPSTRLALAGIEYAMDQIDLGGTESLNWVLDIGTGSGILAIAAVKLGMLEAIGTDIDACARQEAKENVRLNSLGDQITIQHNIPADMPPFRLVTANLRLPTLLTLRFNIAQLTDNGGAIVMAGIKSSESGKLLAGYSELDFKPIWQQSEKKWAVLVFIKA